MFTRQVGIEDIKAKRAALQPPPGLEGAILVTGTLEEEVYTLLNQQVSQSANRPVESVLARQLSCLQSRGGGIIMASEQPMPPTTKLWIA